MQVLNLALVLVSLLDSKVEDEDEYEYKQKNE